MAVGVRKLVYLVLGQIVRATKNKQTNKQTTKCITTNVFSLSRCCSIVSCGVRACQSDWRWPELVFQLSTVFAGLFQATSGCVVLRRLSLANRRHSNRIGFAGEAAVRRSVSRRLHCRRRSQRYSGALCGCRSRTRRRRDVVCVCNHGFHCFETSMTIERATAATPKLIYI
jgi:hypothetical protein